MTINVKNNTDEQTYKQKRCSLEYFDEKTFKQQGAFKRVFLFVLLIIIIGISIGFCTHWPFDLLCYYPFDNLTLVGGPPWSSGLGF